MTSATPSISRCTATCATWLRYERTTTEETAPFRCAYTIELDDTVYALHAFQKHG